MKPDNLFTLWNETICEYLNNRQPGTAHVYRYAYHSFVLYNKGIEALPFGQITPRLLHGYELHLLECGKSWNTIATYMKSLRAVYNRAVRRGLAPYAPELFRNVCTSPRDARKRALPPRVMGSLLKPAVGGKACNRPEKPALRKAHLLFSLMFLLRGMPFVDAAYLRKADLRGDVLTYHRHKTGRCITVRLTPEAQGIIRTLQGMEPPRGGYLLPFLSLPKDSEQSYHEYQCALRSFNRRLKQLAGDCRELDGLSSHCARHTWATTAYHLQMQTGLISEALGHSSISVTEHYLQSFHGEALHAANLQVIGHVLDAASVPAGTMKVRKARRDASGRSRAETESRRPSAGLLPRE